MSERRAATPAVDPVGRSSAGRGGGRTAAAFLLPGLAVAGILAVALVSYDGDCGGPVPGCGNVLNAGTIPILIEGTPAGTGRDKLATVTVPPEWD